MNLKSAESQVDAVLLTYFTPEFDMSQVNVAVSTLFGPK